MASGAVHNEYRYVVPTAEEAARGILTLLVCSLCGERLLGIREGASFHIQEAQVSLHMNGPHEGNRRL